MKNDIFITTDTIKKFRKYNINFDALINSIYSLYNNKISSNINININLCDRNADGYWFYDEDENTHYIEINTKFLTRNKETFIKWEYYKEILTNNNKYILYFFHILCHELEHAVQLESNDFNNLHLEDSYRIRSDNLWTNKEIDAEIGAYENCIRLYKLMEVVYDRSSRKSSR